MKGVIYKCLEELVVTKFGKDKWGAIIEQADFDKYINVLSLSDVDDAKMMDIITATCDVLGINMEQASDAFGDYWCNVYASKVYKPYWDMYQNARSFLLALDDIHVTMTKKIRNAHPPRFRYEWVDDKTLIMHYNSQRNLAILVVGLAKGVGKYYNESINVKQLDDSRIEIAFTS